MIRLTIKEAFREERDESEAIVAAANAAAACAALREGGIEISDADFYSAWENYSAELFAGWISIDGRAPASILFNILPYCDIATGDPRADELIGQMEGMSREAYARRGYDIVSRLLAKR